MSLLQFDFQAPRPSSGGTATIQCINPGGNSPPPKPLDLYENSFESDRESQDRTIKTMHHAVCEPFLT